MAPVGSHATRTRIDRTRPARPAGGGTPGRRSGRRLRRASAVTALAVAAFLLLSARPVSVAIDTGGGAAPERERLLLWAWQRGSASFVNSVTGAPVRIGFGLLTGIDEQHMSTDEKTENYYTSGMYDINLSLRGRRIRSLDYCSVVGIDVVLASHRYRVADGCMEIRLLWPPF